MGDNTIAEKTISHLKLRLESAINARSELEEDFSAQSALLTNFIGKLSQACKGIDKLLDNKLANLRASLKKSTSFADLEKEIKTISALLQQHSVQNDANINKVHEQLQASIVSLQKNQKLPKASRQKFKTLVSNTNESHDSLLQFVPLMSEFIVFYEAALAAKDKAPTVGLLNANNAVSLEKVNKVDMPEESEKTCSDANEQIVSKDLLTRFQAILSTLIISEKHKVDIKKIRSSLNEKISNQVLMTKCLNVFDLIIADLKQERSTAKIFLSTLSETLATVQASVSSTIASTKDVNSKHDIINKELHTKIKEMSNGINDASSLTDMKVDVNDKLLHIAKTLEKKTQLETQQRETLEKKLNKMSSQVEQLELQSQSFEKRIQEQQAKSLQDALTKLGNRAAFDEHFAREIVRFHHKKFDLAITVIDLDDFKRINDTYGHTAGDKTLQVIANTLKKVIGNDAFIGRYGGEEFVLVFSGIDKITVMNKLNVLRKKVASLPFTFKNNRVSITLSIGVSLVQENDNVHSSFERADDALYKAKKDGKNRVIYG